MGRKFNVSVIILIFVSICLAGIGFYLFQNYQKEYAKNLTLQEELTEIKARYSEAQKELKETKKLVFDLQIKSEAAELKIGKLNDELSLKETARQEALSMLEQIKSDLQEQKDLRADLENRLDQARAGAKKSQEQLIKLDLEKKGLEARIKELEAKPRGVELGTIVVGPEFVPAAPQVKTEGIVETAPALKPKAKKALKPKAKKAVKPKAEKVLKSKAEKAMKPKAEKAVETAKSKPVSLIPISAQEPILKGKILTVNKDYDFVVIDLGSQNDVITGQIFSVYSGNEYLGDIKVEKVHDSLSAAGFITSGMKDKVSEGDEVVKKRGDK